VPPTPASPTADPLDGGTVDEPGGATPAAQQQAAQQQAAQQQAAQQQAAQQQAAQQQAAQQQAAQQQAAQQQAAAQQADSPPDSTPAPATNGPSAAVNDPPAVEYSASPPPGQPITATQNLVTLYVPADLTMLQMGTAADGPSPGANTSGFRVSTANHAHVTAQTPLTTISLGAPSGQGLDAGIAGLNLYTQGAKYEHVEGAVTVEHQSTVNETVKDNASHTYQAALDVTIFKDRTDTIKGMWNVKCEQKEIRDTFQDKHDCRFANSTAVTIGNKYESVVGNTTSLAIGNKTTFQQGDKTDTTHGDSTATVQGDSELTVWGKSKTTRFGNVVNKLIGGTWSNQVGDVASFYKGGKFEMVAGMVMRINAAIEVTVKPFSNDKMGLKIFGYDTKMENGKIDIRNNELTSIK
jgi:hypothetical protein